MFNTSANPIRYAHVARIASLLFFAFLAGCHSVQTAAPQSVSVDVEALLDDGVFTDPDTFAIETPESLFYLSKDAKNFVDNSLKTRDSGEKELKNLIIDIFDRSKYDLLYQADANTNANDTFENRSANCLSLTIMTYAMAKHAGFNTRFQQIDIPEFWTRKSGFALLNGHINLRILPQHEASSIKLFRKDIVIDFDPQQGVDDFAAQEISQERIVAMFYNNKAAELILKGKMNHAYAYLKAALEHDPLYNGAILNLGLAYRQIGELALAEKAYLAAISINERYLTAWENLAALYDKTQRQSQASEIYARLQKQRVNNPYYHLMLAEEALENKKFKQSIRNYKDAIALDDSPHQFYFGIAKAYFQLGDFNNTQRYLRLAKSKAGKARISGDYSEKLSMLADLKSQES
jgi:tetratricopeptide (TPR) repeat protein